MTLAQATERYQQALENERQAFEAVKLSNDLLTDAVQEVVDARGAMLDAWHDYTHGTGVAVA